MPDNVRPPRTAVQILSCFGGRHLQEILGDLTEEFNERVESTGVSAARQCYWWATLRNMIALAAGGQMTGKASPRTLLLISGVWFGIALLWVWLSHRWLMGFEHQAWGIVTMVLLLMYVILVTGWVVPMLWGIARLGSSSITRGEHFQ